MRKSLYATAFLLLACITIVNAQLDEEVSRHALSARLTFLDYGTLNGSEARGSNGLEITYIRNISKHVNVGLPFKVGVANINEELNKRVISSLDGIVQFHAFDDQRRLVPYLFGGAGFAIEQMDIAYLSLPVGAGLNIKLGKNSYATFQAEYRHAFETDRSNLQYGLGYWFKLNRKEVDEPVVGDVDEDGIPDELDVCPNLKGLAQFSGCPDTDGDGIGDQDDACVAEAGLAAFNGCPDPNQKTITTATSDRDNDGIADRIDACPDAPGTLGMKGCPDTDNDKVVVPEPVVVNRDRDNDGVFNDFDKCPDLAGLRVHQGCPDTDNDGIIDTEDECPNEVGNKNNNGCPVKDDDNDGINNDMDECPKVFGVVQFKGCPDTDNDGVQDSEDECPKEAGEKDNKGCPNNDTDGDGFLNDVDECRTIPGKVNGCPDSDKDGIADKDDMCPNEKGELARHGCPLKDTDGDGINDDSDDCPNEKGPLSLNGCPDSDGDGIANNVDKCPKEAGTFDNNGCPQIDSDMDGIANKYDECPYSKGSLYTNGCPDKDSDGVADKNDACPDVAGKVNGCPDSDGDGVANKFDKCPDMAGSSSASGCPALDASERKVLADAAHAIHFETGKASLKAMSFNTLDDVIAILNRYPHYALKIEGYTDNVGRSESNQSLSEERAKACYEYLIARGFDSSKVSYAGLGEKNPIATNSTDEGKRLNRRVEFVVYMK